VLYAYVNPSDVVNGDLVGVLDAVRATPVLVCIRRSQNMKSSFARLLEIAEDTAATPRLFALG
jgi:hypothetical protein